MERKTRIDFAGFLLPALSVFLTLGFLTALEGEASASRGGKDGDENRGWLLLPEFATHSQLKQMRGFVAPRLFVYTEEGEAIPKSGSEPGWEPAELVPLPEGSYQVEVGHTPHPANRWRYRVRAGQVTLVRTGLVALSTAHVDDQPPDVCRPWRARMWAHVRDSDGDTHQIAAAAGSEVSDFSILQLHEGTYQFLFNGLTADLEVRADRSIFLPTAMVAPVGRRDFRLSVEKSDAADNPSILLCADRPTQVLAGSYWGSYHTELKRFPYRERVWRQMEIDPVERPRYVRLRSPSPPRRVYTGPGSRPERVAP